MFALPFISGFLSSLHRRRKRIRGQVGTVEKLEPRLCATVDLAWLPSGINNVNFVDSTGTNVNGLGYYVQIKNVGTTALTQDVNVSLIVSQDDVLGNGDDILVGDTDFEHSGTISLAAGGSSIAHHTSFGLAATIDVNVYRTSFMVIDLEGQVAESNESNNVRSQPIPIPPRIVLNKELAATAQKGLRVATEATYNPGDQVGTTGMFITLTYDPDIVDRAYVATGDGIRQKGKGNKGWIKDGKQKVARITGGHASLIDLEFTVNVSNDTVQRIIRNLAFDITPGGNDDIQIDLFAMDNRFAIGLHPNESKTVHVG